MVVFDDFVALGWDYILDKVDDEDFLFLVGEGNFRTRV